MQQVMYWYVQPQVTLPAIFNFTEETQHPDTYCWLIQETNETILHYFPYFISLVLYKEES